MYIPSELKYVANHVWIQDEGDGTVTIGITDYAQQELGDVVFVELPKVGGELATDDEFGIIEAAKATSDLYAPIAGTVIAVNQQLEDEPELINSDPYGEAWICKLCLNNENDLQQLLDADAYSELCEE